MGSTEDDGELIDQLRLEIDILDRVLYRHTNQHRRAKYFKQLKIVRRKARLIVNSKDHHELDVDEIKDVQNLAVSAAETFTVLLGRSYFIICTSVHFSVGQNCVLSYNQYNMLYWRRNQV